MNLGEVLKGHNPQSKLKETANVQLSTLTVHAEPYRAVHQPGHLVVVEKVFRSDTSGTTEAVDARHALMERRHYIPNVCKFDPVVSNAKVPLGFFKVRSALRIARLEGAER